MRWIWILATIFGLSGAQATTYQFTEYGFDFTLGGTVDLQADTTNYTGTISLAPGDTAHIGLVFYPNTPPSIPGAVYDNLSATLTFEGGVITSWGLSGTYLQPPPAPCEGPCGSTLGESFGADGTVGVGGEFQVFVYEPGGAAEFTSNEIGTWTQVTAVPEPTTWVMLLIGLATIGFAGALRRHHRFPKPEGAEAT
jgi:hypothetical protein